MTSAQQGSHEWLTQRLGKVTASRLSDVCAVGKSGVPAAGRMAYMVELMAEVLTGVPCKSFDGNTDTERGIALEPTARALYEIKTGSFVMDAPFVLHPSIERAGASPDGLVGDDGLIEIKCPRPHSHLAYMTSGEVPAKYIPQMAWQIACTGRQWVDFVSYCEVMPEHLRLHVIRYETNDQHLHELEERVRCFLSEMDDRLAMLPKPQVEEF